MYANFDSNQREVMLHRSVAEWSTLLPEAPLEEIFQLAQIEFIWRCKYNEFYRLIEKHGRPGLWHNGHWAMVKRDSEMLKKHIYRTKWGKYIFDHTSYHTYFHVEKIELLQQVKMELSRNV